MQPSPFYERQCLIRFGGVTSRHHDCVVKIEPSSFDASVRVHLVVRAGDRRFAARDVLTWDPVAEELVWQDRAELGVIAGRLDGWVAACSIVLDGLKAIMDGAGALFECISSPNVILIGGIFPILIALWLFYSLMFFVAKMLLLYLCLPVIIVGTIIGAMRNARVDRFEDAVITAALAALTDYWTGDPWSNRRAAC